MMNANDPTHPARGDIVLDAEFDRIHSDLQKIYVGRGSDVIVAKTLQAQRDHRNAWVDLRDRWREGDETAGEVQPYECRAIVLTGESGAGKSTLLRRVLGPPPRPGANSLPIVSLQVPGPATLLTLGRALLDKLGYPISDHAKEHVVWENVRRQLALANTEVLHFDEVQNITGTANRKEAPKIRNALRAHLIDGEHPVILVLSGLPEITPFLASDIQILRRSGFRALETLSPEDAALLTDVLEKMAAKADLKVDYEGDLLPRLMHAVCRQFGSAVELCVEATLRAVRPVDDFGTRLPRERRLTTMQFGAVYADRSGNAPFANPFLVENWHKVDPTLVGITHPGQIPPEDDGPLTSRKRRSKGKKGGHR